MTSLMGQDDAEVPISAIEHYSYCPRQCALIHVEQTYEENLFTVRGQLAHERVDAEHQTTRRGTPLGLVPHVQARLLARHLREDLRDYPPFRQR